MTTVNEVVILMKKTAVPSRLEGMQRYGINAAERLGLSVPEMRKIARGIGKNHKLALELWKTGIAEAKIIAAMVGDPEQLTEAQMENWVKGINSWDICDQVCMNLFCKSKFAWKKVNEWAARDEEFVKRTAFSLLACLAWYEKQAEDRRFTTLLPLIVQGATDERNFVKKAVNWALRTIGKKNPLLNAEAIKTAQEIRKLNSRAARWIAADAIRELESDAVKKRLGIGK